MSSSHGSGGHNQPNGAGQGSTAAGANNLQKTTPVNGVNLLEPDAFKVRARLLSRST